MAYYSQMFAYWRGSLKVHFRFLCSQFTTATVRITHNTYNEVSASPEVVAGARVSEIVEIRGNTEWSRALPWRSAYDWALIPGFRDIRDSPIAADLARSSLEVTVVNPAVSTADAGDATIFVAIYISGGPYIDFKDHVGVFFRKTSVEVADSEVQKRLDELRPAKQGMLELFAKDFKPMHPAVASLDQGWVKESNETNLCDLLHRETPAPGDEWAYPTYPGYYTDDPGFIWYLINPFLAWRGSMNVRFSLNKVGGDNPMVNSWIQWAAYDDTMTKSLFMDETPGLPYPVRVYDESNDPSLQVAVSCPWLFHMPFRSVHDDYPADSPPADPLLQAPWNSGEVRHFVSCGDDFALSLPCVPTSIVVPTPPPAPLSGATLSRLDSEIERSVPSLSATLPSRRVASSSH
jgi:hypothetical protein